MTKLAMVRKNARVHPHYQSRLEWVPCRLIEVRPEAQRKFKPKWAAEIAENFDPDLLGYPVLVADMIGKQERFWVVSGQHRVAAVRIALGHEQQIECEVIRGISVARAAALFLGLSCTRGVRQIDRFLVGVTAEDPDCLAIKRTAEALQLRVRDGDAPGTLQAVASLHRIYSSQPEKDRAPHLRRVLQLALTAWGRAADSFNGNLLTGISHILVRHGKELDIEALERTLRGYRGGALGLLGKARAYREAVGGSIGQCVAHTIIAAYNTGRTKHRLPLWGAK